MIIKGKSRAGPRQLAAHLTNVEKNERVTVLETRGTVAADLKGALREMDAYGVGTNCEKTLYHAAISPEPPHRLTPEQRAEAIDALEKKLGLNGHARVVVMHEKLGREHIHVVWSRIDIDKMRAVSDSHNYRKHEEVARDLERRFGHERVQGAHYERDGKERPERTPSAAELRQEERTGISRAHVVSEVTAAFRSADGPEAFRTALEDRGFMLAKGDRRDYVVVDRAGGIHSLARRIDVEGMKAAQLREFMTPLDRDSVPTVEQAKAIQLDRTRSVPSDYDLGRWEDTLAASAIDKAKEQDRIDRLLGEERAGAKDRLKWDDALAASGIEKAKAEDKETERRRAEKRQSAADAKIDKAYGRGDDYVSQTQAARKDHERRQEVLDKSSKLQPLRPSGAQDDAARRKADDEDRQRQRRQGEEPRLKGDYAAKQRDGGRSDKSEITDRMARLLGQFDDRGHDRDGPDHDTEPDRQRPAPGGGRTRSR